MLSKTETHRGHADLNIVRGMQPLQQLAYWITTREAIRIRKEAGESPPWTDDPILAEYKFCNVNREDDQVTKWLRENWRGPYAYDQHLWHGMAVARWINLPASLEEAGWPEPWLKRRDAFLRVLAARMARDVTLFSGAYLIQTML